MAARRLRLPRGNATNNDSQTLPAGCVTVDTTNNRLRLHDGSAAGGHAAAKLSEVLRTDGTGLAVISPSQLTGNVNDYAPTSHATTGTMRLSSDASRDITGLQGGSAGRILALVNVGSFPIVLKSESGSSTAAYRFALPYDLTIPAGYGVLLQYDGTSSRWRLIGAPPVQQPLTVHQFDLVHRPLYNSTSSADPALPTLAATDTTLSSDTSDPDGVRAGKNFADGALAWVSDHFVVPAELDTTQAIDCKLTFVLLGNASTGDTAEWTLHYRARKGRETHLSGGASGSVSGIATLSSHNSGHTGTLTITAAIPANTLEAGDSVTVTIERNARADNASDDTYGNTLVLTGGLLEGKRKLWS